ncbi:MAG TPA: hypothetical protein V6D04_05250, partial [Candidatus Obscuribacterales bacterium]
RPVIFCLKPESRSHRDRPSYFLLDCLTIKNPSGKNPAIRFCALSLARLMLLPEATANMVAEATELI